MSILHSSKAYVYNLQTTSSAEAKRLWRKDVKEKWHFKCAYCGDGNNLTIDHVVPRSKGGTDFTKNVVCCCSDCNQRKGHEPWEQWFLNQSSSQKRSTKRLENGWNQIHQKTYSNIVREGITLVE